MSETAIFHIEGGIGKHIAATAVVECYKTQPRPRYYRIVRMA
jgi:hypothetical protein